MEKTDQTTEFLPCPHCGSDDIAPITFKGCNDDVWDEFIACGGCGATAETVEIWNSRAELACTLTAEQVMAIAGKHQPDYCSDTHVCFDWQAIADELNATLGRRECEYVIEDNMNESEGMGDVWFRCTNCNTTFDYYADDWLMKQNYCPHCGLKIRKAVDE